MPVATAAGLSTRIEQAINQSLVLDPLSFVLRGIVTPRHKLPGHPKDKLLILKVLPVACGGSGFHLGVRSDFLPVNCCCCHGHYDMHQNDTFECRYSGMSTSTVAANSVHHPVSLL